MSKTKALIRSEITRRREYRLKIAPMDDNVLAIYENHLESIYELGISHSPGIGFDIYFPESCQVEPNSEKETYGATYVGLGIKCEMLDEDDNNVHYSITTRSSYAKQPLRFALTQGDIEADYRGELKVPLDNWTTEDQFIEAETSLFKIIGPDKNATIIPQIVSIDDLSKTDRNEGGFGSTGVKLNERVLYLES